MPPMPVKSALYDLDFYAWSNEQAALLREGKLSQADLEHTAEEIESMGKPERRELSARLTILDLHLLKWQFQRGMRSRSWRLSVQGPRLDVEDHLRDNPSFKAIVSDAIAPAYRRALIELEKETGLEASTFPATCPYSFEQMRDDDFWPE
jgi:hypothetical protein